MTERFTKSFTQQEPLPAAAVTAALAVLGHGRLHRYDTAGAEIAETARLEEEFAALTGARYCLAVASGGTALSLALRAIGVGPGDRVLTNAFTLAPVPGAIAGLGALPVFVETTEALTIDMGDLAAKAGGAKALLLSHMRGHIADMDRVMTLADDAGLPVIEDCAHTMGAAWCGRPTGRFGTFGCFSTQTYKHVNSGEGGLIIGDDDALMARAVLLSGSYMLYPRHRAAPPEAAFAALKGVTPNLSGRMDNLRAAILRPQIAVLAERAGRWNALYRALEAGLAEVPGLALVPRPAEEGFVGSSFQFRLPDWPPGRIAAFLAGAAARGVALKWFGAAEAQGYTARHDHWAYVPRQNLPATDRILAGLLDLRLPLSFTEDDVRLIARIIRAEVMAARDGGDDAPPAAD